MKIYIDQSGKIEETHRDTILAYSNGVSFSARITARTKRRLQDRFRAIGEPRFFVLYVFTAAIFLIVKPRIGQLSRLVIDTEYPGYGEVILDLMRRLASNNGRIKDINLLYAQIGKRASAHKIAIDVLRKNRRCDRILTYEELSESCFKINKNGYPVLKYQPSRR